MHLRACGDFILPIDNAGSDLKDSVADAVGQPVRRISRFIQLGLIGAGRCARGQTLPGDTAVYLASSRGDLELTTDILDLVFREGHAPKPLSFVNTVSNSAAFYIAKCLGLQSRSAFACSRYFAFEDALQLALIDMQLGNIDSALVGCVESAVRARHDDRDDSELDGAPLTAEASHWLWFTRERGEDSLARIVDVHAAADRTALFNWIDRLALDPASCTLSQGQYLTPTEFAALQAKTGMPKSLDYRDMRTHYSSESGAAIGSFVRASESGRTLLHVNGDAMGRYVAMVVMR